MNKQNDNIEKQGSLQLDEKLFLLQNEIGSISKDSDNPFYESKYFDINSLLSQLQPLLYKYRLLLTQPIEDGYQISQIKCIDSKKYEQSKLQLPEINDPQKLGSAITFYRRYTLTALLALQAEDDDANATVTNDLEWLNFNTKQYTEVYNALEAKKCDINYVKSVFRLSKKVEQELLKIK